MVKTSKYTRIFRLQKAAILPSVCVFQMVFLFINYVYKWFIVWLYSVIATVITNNNINHMNRQ